MSGFPAELREYK